MEEEGEKPKE